MHTPTPDPTPTPLTDAEREAVRLTVSRAITAATRRVDDYSHRSVTDAASDAASEWFVAREAAARADERDRIEVPLRALCDEWATHTDDPRAYAAARVLDTLDAALTAGGDRGRPARYDPETKTWRDQGTGEPVPSEPDAAWIAGGHDG